MAWVDLSGAFGYGTILTSTQMQELRDNIVHVRESGDGQARIYLGTYTGDGTTSKAISGVGFEPLFVKIWVRPSSDGAANMVERIDNANWTDFGFAHIAGGGHGERDDTIISMDADGFTVSDAGLGTDSDPNTSGETYDFMCIGISS